MCDIFGFSSVRLMQVIVYSVFLGQQSLLPARCFQQPVSGEMISISSVFTTLSCLVKLLKFRKRVTRQCHLPALLGHPQPASVRTCSQARTSVHTHRPAGELAACVPGSPALPSTRFFLAVPTPSLPVPFPSHV